MRTLNQTSLTHYAATIAKAFGVEAPAQAEAPLDWVCDCLADYCKAGFDRLFIHNPDAVGMWLHQKYPDAFAPVLRNTQLTIPFQTVMPSVTPVCFGTMYTGAQPAVHGIQKYEKPVIQIDTLFDALARAGKKIALVSTESASMSNIFKGRKMDVYNCTSEGAIVEKALELIIQDRYDVLCVYTYMFDTQDHAYGPEAPETLAALYGQGVIFDYMVSAIRRNWTQHNTLVSFSPDHGVHACPEGSELLGDHGTDSPLDLNILHFLGTVVKRAAE